jgi:hypothetical protein
MFSCNKVSTAAFGVINPTTNDVIQFLGPAVFHATLSLKPLGVKRLKQASHFQRKPLPFAVGTLCLAGFTLHDWQL